MSGPRLASGKGGEDGVVFATPERARYVASLHDAIDSKTWGEFRSRIPAEEWQQLAEGFDEAPRLGFQCAGQGGLGNLCTRI